MPVLVSSPRFIGRREELAVLEAALTRAEAGEGSVVLVSGESGMGKSRLIESFVTTARARGAVALIGECLELADGELPYAPIAGALRSLLHEATNDAVAPDSAALEQLLAELTPGSLPIEGDTQSAVSRARLFERLVATLFDLSRRAPAVVMVVEDLHWADRSTGDFISFLVRGARRQRLVLIVSYRSDELDRRHPLRPLVLELERSGRAERLALRPFDRNELIDQVTAIIDAPPEPSLIDRLAERAEGNPFFAEELLAASVAPGSALPESLRDTLLLRVEELSPRAQSVLRIAAVAGRTVDHALLAAVADLPEDQLAQALEEAVSRHMIVQDPSATGFSFRHALLREAVYADLLPGRRRALHVALARALSDHPELCTLRAGSAAELAHHWYAADDLGEALSTSVRAGMDAQAVHAHAEALLHYDRALEVWERAAGAHPPADRLTVIRRAADAANLSGDSQRAMALAHDALAMVDEGANPAVAALVRERLGRYSWAAGREEDALLEYRRAVELMPADPPSRERALVLSAEGQALMLIGRAAESAVRCMEAIEIAKRVGARVVEANALNTVSANCSGDGDFEQAIDAASRARAIARRLVDVEEIGRSYVNGSDALDQAGRIEESLALAREGIDVAGKLGIDRLFGDFLRAEMTARLFRTGRWVEADNHLLELSERAPTGLPDAMLHLNRGFLEAERGEFDAAARDIDRAERLSSGMRGAMWHAPNSAARATMELWMGNPEAAAATIRKGLASDEESAHVFFTARLHDLGARAAADISRQAPEDDRLRVRQQTVARALLQRLDGLLQEVKHAAPSVLASRAACAAELSRIGGGDASAWADAERLWEQTGDRYQAAYARFRRAEALVASGQDVRAAHDLLRDAHLVAAELSAQPLVSEIEALARRSGLDLVASDGIAPSAEPDLATHLPAQTSGVTAVLFSDIENSTLLLDRLGDEAFMQLLAQHNRVVREQIPLHGGREIKTAGDSFMVAFGQPRRALACAVAIQRAVVDIKPAIRVRIGLHAGETLYQQDDLFGRHVVVAARVAALAGGGEILATSLIRELAEGATGLRFGPRREHTLKGLSGTQSVYSLQWSGATETLA